MRSSGILDTAEMEPMYVACKLLSGSIYRASLCLQDTEQLSTVAVGCSGPAVKKWSALKIS